LVSSVAAVRTALLVSLFSVIFLAAYLEIPDKNKSGTTPKKKVPEMKIVLKYYFSRTEYYIFFFQYFNYIFMSFVMNFDKFFTFVFQLIYFYDIYPGFESEHLRSMQQRSCARTAT
jgi:hypothetical protein